MVKNGFSRPRSFLLLVLIQFLFLWGAVNRVKAATFEGRVLDQETKDPVPLAAIFVGTIARAEADSSGRFRFDDLPAGEYLVRVEHVGFEPWHRTFRMSEAKTTETSVRLRPRVQTLEPLEIVSARPDPSVPQGKRTITAMKIRKGAGTVATDPLRAIQALPGAAAAGGDDFSDRYVVRGGDPEENVVLFDSYVLLQPIHLEGFTSVTYDDLIGGVDVYPGALPPRFGDALSSVTALSPVRPKRTRAFFRYDLGSIAIGGETLKGGTSAIGAARASFYNLLLRRPPGIHDRNFQDVSGKVTHDRGSLETTVTAIGSRDREHGDFDRSVDAFLVGARVGGKPGPRTARAGLALSQRDRITKSRKAPNAPLVVTQADLLRASATGELLWSIGSNVQARGDVELHQDRFEDGRLRHEDQGGFAAAEGTWSSRTAALSAGGRFEKIAFTKSAPFSPYVSARFRRFGRVVPGAGFRIVRQSPFPLYDNPEVAGLPIDPGSLLEAARDHVVPLQATHVSASCEADLGRGLAATVELYQKRYEHLTTWSDPAGPKPGDVRDDGTGTGRGIEMTLRRDTGRYATGWISYSISRTRKREGPATVTRPADHDRPRMLQLSLDVPVQGGTSFTFGYRASAGRPLTPMIALGDGTKVPGEINSERLPSYARLDVKLEHRIIGDKRDAFFYLDVLNLLNRKNIVDVTQFVSGGQVYRILNQGVRITPVAGFGVYFF